MFYFLFQILCLFFSVDGASHPRFDWETIAKLALAAIVIFGVAWFRQYGFKKINLHMSEISTKPFTHMHKHDIFRMIQKSEKLKQK